MHRTGRSRRGFKSGVPGAGSMILVDGGQRLHRSIMNQDSQTPERPATRAPVFFWITAGLLAILLLGGCAIGLFLLHEAENINREGGLGWHLFGVIYVVTSTVA